jgi:hypothetical protein
MPVRDHAGYSDHYSRLTNINRQVLIILITVSPGCQSIPYWWPLPVTGHPLYQNRTLRTGKQIQSAGNQQH